LEVYYNGSEESPTFYGVAHTVEERENAIPGEPIIPRERTEEEIKADEEAQKKAAEALTTDAPDENKTTDEKDTDGDNTKEDK
jgi:hypothetical protein